MQKIETATDIKTDIGQRQCSFKVAPTVDWKAKLVEFAKTNTHLADYTIRE